MVDLDLERVRHLLPESMLDIVEAIGVKSACELVKAIGGARFKFGRGKQDTPRLHILFAAIGIVALRNEKGSYNVSGGLYSACGIVALRNEKGSYNVNRLAQVL